MVMPEAERTTHLSSLHKRLDEAVVSLSAQTARDAAKPVKDCQGERPTLKPVTFGERAQ